MLDFAAARGWRDASNPTRWRDLRHDLPATSKLRPERNQAALPWEKGARFHGGPAPAHRDGRTRAGAAHPDRDTDQRVLEAPLPPPATRNDLTTNRKGGEAKAQGSSAPHACDTSEGVGHGVAFPGLQKTLPVIIHPGSKFRTGSTRSSARRGAGRRGRSGRRAGDVARACVGPYDDVRPCSGTRWLMCHGISSRSTRTTLPNKARPSRAREGRRQSSSGAGRRAGKAADRLRKRDFAHVISPPKPVCLAAQ